ncbi:unnamed protein product [Ceratitis capitata]|uniref:(Mediterranean fruit fly) hypothetical protein n=1 Tax=Ceratitis capitata TaxID=7213 RepID=A0A811V793_CERCA|nr:unnamed protein product [Ceratitis capitata]
MEIPTKVRKIQPAQKAGVCPINENNKISAAKTTRNIKIQNWKNSSKSHKRKPEAKSQKPKASPVRKPPMRRT